MLTLCLAFALPLRAQSADAVPQRPTAAVPQVSSERVLQTVRHTLVATVGTVTRVAMPSPWRLDAGPAGGSARWRRAVQLRGNVPMRLELAGLIPMPVAASGSEAPNAEVGSWRVRLVDGQAIPLRVDDGVVTVAQRFRPGRHDLELFYEAHDRSVPPPALQLRAVPVGALP